MGLHVLGKQGALASNPHSTEETRASSVHPQTTYCGQPALDSSPVCESHTVFFKTCIGFKGNLFCLFLVSCMSLIKWGYFQSTLCLDKLKVVFLNMFDLQGALYVWPPVSSCPCLQKPAPSCRYLSHASPCSSHPSWLICWDQHRDWLCFYRGPTWRVQWTISTAPAASQQTKAPGKSSAAERLGGTGFSSQ